MVIFNISHINWWWYTCCCGIFQLETHLKNWIILNRIFNKDMTSHYCKLTDMRWNFDAMLNAKWQADYINGYPKQEK